MVGCRKGQRQCRHDLNHSKYTVQNITNEWKKKNLNNNTKLRGEKHVKRKKRRKKEKQTSPPATNTSHTSVRNACVITEQFLLLLTKTMAITHNPWQL